MMMYSNTSDIGQQECLLGTAGHRRMCKEQQGRNIMTDGSLFPYLPRAQQDDAWNDNGGNDEEQQHPCNDQSPFWAP